MTYIWIKSLHIIAMVAWMAGMLYLPRLFVYHVGAKRGGELSETLKLMEQRLLRLIMNPAMIVTIATGAWMIWQNPEIMKNAFMHTKLTAVLLMLGAHGFLARCRGRFAMDKNAYSARFYRILNEVPTILLILIVVMIVIRP